MTGYVFIQDLLTNTFAKSKAIGGRFYISSQRVTEINSDDLGNIISDEVKKIVDKKYPLVIMGAPVSYGTYVEPNSWDEYNISLFFLKTTYQSSTGQPGKQNVNTRTSQHTIVQDWHDMKRVAVNFLKALNSFMPRGGMTFRLTQNKARYITPVSQIGVDLVSGVRLDFTMQLFTDCLIEDYPDGFNTIALPDADSHPEHKL